MIDQPIYVEGWGAFNLQRREQFEGAEFPVYPWVKVCPYCLARWAWDNTYGHHSVHGVSCERCNRPDYHSPVPGSLLDDRARLATDWDLLEDLPYSLLLREFQLHVKYLERSEALQLHHNDPLRTGDDPLASGGEVG